MSMREAAILLLAIGFLVRIVVAFLFPNIHRPDEVFQTLEPAFRFLSGGGIITWEWHEGIRSPLFPGAIAGILNLGRALNLTPSAAVSLVHAFLAALSAMTVWIGFRIGWLKFGWPGAILCGTLCAAWPDLVYFGPKTLTEVQAGNLLIIALYLGVYAPSEHSSSEVSRPASLWRTAGCGFLLGTTFILRFPLAVAVAVATIAVFACGRDFRRRWPILVLAFLIPVLVSGLTDRLYWGSWFQSIWLNYYLNATQHISDEYGIQGRLFFFRETLRLWGLISIPMGLAILFGLRRAPALGAVAVAVIMSHTLIAHKEISFIYASLPPLVILAGLGATELLVSLSHARRGNGGLIVIATCLCIAACAVTAVGAHFRPRWTQSAGFLRAAQIIAADPDACGISLQYHAVGWYNTGGDVFLGRDIPYYPYETKAGLDLALQASNYALTSAKSIDFIPGYDLLGCWPGYLGRFCLSRSEWHKKCVPNKSFDLNSVSDLGRTFAHFGSRR